MCLPATHDIQDRLSCPVHKLSFPAKYHNTTPYVTDVDVLIYKHDVEAQHLRELLQLLRVLFQTGTLAKCCMVSF